MTTDKPVDLMTLQRVAEEAGHERGLRARLDTLQLVTFLRNPQAGKSDPVGKHPVNGRPIFPDKRRRGGEIRAGETWFCELDEFRPKGGSPVYYGNPVTKIDPSYLFDLRSDQVDRILEALQGTSQGTLLEAAKTKIRSELEKTAQSQIEVAQRERDAARGDADNLRGELDRIREANIVLKREAESIKAQQASPLAPPALGADEATAPSPESPLSEWPTLGNDPHGALRLRRPSGTTVASPLLRDGRYFAHVSPDRGRLLIRWHPAGNLVAIGQKIEVPGLDVLRPFDAPEELHGSYDTRSGGILVELRGTT